MLTARGRAVTLSGTWVRRNTSSRDITSIRHDVYAMNRLADNDLTGQLPRITFTAKNAGWEDSERYSRKTREGTFTVTVFVHSKSLLPENQVAARAKAMVRWLVQDMTCVPPRLTFDAVEMGRYRW
jgi:hypothetical protein